MFTPVKKLLRKELNISLYEFIFLIFQSLENDKEKKNNKKIPEKFLKIYFDFSKESEEELYESKKHIEEYFSNDENYKKLLDGELGDNLLRKYAAKLISNVLNEIMDLSVDTISELVPKTHENKNEITNILESARLWLKNLYIFDAIFKWDEATKHQPVISLEYDIPKWDKNQGESILNFKKKTNYKMVYSKQNENINNELFALYGKHDKNFAIGKYFHQINANLDDIRRSSNLILS